MCDDDSDENRHLNYNASPHMILHSLCLGKAEKKTNICEYGANIITADRLIKKDCDLCFIAAPSNH